MFTTAKPFNADLYTVAATVLPLFFLALALPGGILARYYDWATKRGLTWADIMVPVAGAFLAFFVWGEISAVSAIDHRHATPSEHELVRLSLIGMPIIAAVSTITAALLSRFAFAPEGSGEDAGQ